jgi:predicted HTH domain antitoxin
LSGVNVTTVVNFLRTPNPVRGSLRQAGKGERRRGNPSDHAADEVYNRSENHAMESVPVQLDQDLVDLLEELQRPARESARELIVLELYRQGEVSSGRAAQLLGKEREEFIRYASQQGIPYFQLENDELQRELDTFKKL